MCKYIHVPQKTEEQTQSTTQSSCTAEAYVGTEESLRDLQREGERPADQRLLRHGVHAYTDGSWYESSGRVASAFIITDPKSRVIVFKGGGNDKYKPALDYAEGLIHNTVKMSSTRAEGEGLLRLHIGLPPPGHTNRRCILVLRNIIVS